MSLLIYHTFIVKPCINSPKLVKNKLFFKVEGSKRWCFLRDGSTSRRRMHGLGRGGGRGRGSSVCFKSLEAICFVAKTMTLGENHHVFLPFPPKYLVILDFSLSNTPFLSRIML